MGRRYIKKQEKKVAVEQNMSTISRLSSKRLNLVLIFPTMRLSVRHDRATLKPLKHSGHGARRTVTFIKRDTGAYTALGMKRSSARRTWSMANVRIIPQWSQSQ